MAPRAKKYAKKSSPEQKDDIAGLTRFKIPRNILWKVVQYLKEHPGLVDVVTTAQDLAMPHDEIGELRAQGTWPHAWDLHNSETGPPSTHLQVRQC